MVSRYLRTVIGRSRGQLQTGLGIVRVLAGYGEILKENKGPLFGQTSLLDFFRPSLGTRVSPPVLLGTEDGDQDDPPTVQEKVLTP